ncbi:MAG: class I SAM-dependent methyltransferase [Planctomycetota bacterium]|nr:MAG: class I SAM-dependent methyltransferase [Planctomycetota bacterium]
MTSPKELLVLALGLVGLATPAYRVYERLLARRERQQVDAPTIGADGLPFPPAALMHSVAGTADTDWFLEGGGKAAQALRDILAHQDQSLDQMERLLEFGCGCGRVVRQLQDLPGQVHGCDWNERATDWCRRNLGFAHFEQNTLAPPLPYDAQSFDFIYALSVFTHMGEDLQRPWMDELRRVLKPGGLLVLSTHGRRYGERLSGAERRTFERGEFLVRHVQGAGTNLCSSFHPEAYLRGAFSGGFELLEIVLEGARGNPHQDLTLLRRPRSDSASGASA